MTDTAVSILEEGLGPSSPKSEDTQPGSADRWADLERLTKSALVVLGHGAFDDHATSQWAAYRRAANPSAIIALLNEHDEAASTIRAQADEIERLRGALERIAHPEYGLGFNRLRGIGRAALSTNPDGEATDE